jgi:hypothetical protein
MAWWPLPRAQNALGTLGRAPPGGEIACEPKRTNKARLCISDMIPVNHLLKIE